MRSFSINNLIIHPYETLVIYATHIILHVTNSIRGVICAFLWVIKMEKKGKMFDLHSQKKIFSRNVIFEVSYFPYQIPFSPSSTSSDSYYSEHDHTDLTLFQLPAATLYTSPTYSSTISQDSSSPLPFHFSGPPPHPPLDSSDRTSAASSNQPVSSLNHQCLGPPSSSQPTSNLPPSFQPIPVPFTGLTFCDSSSPPRSSSSGVSFSLQSNPFLDAGLQGGRLLLTNHPQINLYHNLPLH